MLVFNRSNYQEFLPNIVYTSVIMIMFLGVYLSALNHIRVVVHKYLM